MQNMPMRKNSISSIPCIPRLFMEGKKLKIVIQRYKAGTNAINHREDEEERKHTAAGAIMLIHLGHKMKSFTENAKRTHGDDA